MPEIELAAGDVFQLARNDKRHLCQVRGCRKKRKPEHRLCHGHDRLLWGRRNPTKYAFNNLRSSARARKLEFALTLEDFAALARATGYMEGRGTTSLSLSIDRLDARLGYFLENLRVITFGENSGKGNAERREIFRKGVRIPWDEMDLATHNATETERRKSFVPYFQQGGMEPPPCALPDDEEPEWLR